MTETTEATAADETQPAVEATAADETRPAVEAEGDGAPAVAGAEQPVAEAQAEEEAEEPAEEAPEPDTAPVAVADEAPMRVARVFLCERGHRTTTIWSTPTTCRARPLRSGPECGRQLYPIGELPDQVRRALNPLKASKKSSKK